MDSQTPSTPEQRSCSPSLPSWRLSELSALVDNLDAAREVLGRVQLVEPMGYVRSEVAVARESVDDALVSVHNALRALGRA